MHFYIRNIKATERDLKVIPTVANVHLRISNRVKHPHILLPLLLSRPGAQTLIPCLSIIIIAIFIIKFIIKVQGAQTLKYPLAFIIIIAIVSLLCTLSMQ